MSFVPILVASPDDKVRNGPYVYPKGPYEHIQQAKGRAEAMMWAVERSDGGRGFGFTGGHFHDNWGNANYRKVVLNGMVWLAKGNVPKKRNRVFHFRSRSQRQFGSEKNSKAAEEKVVVPQDSKKIRRSTLVKLIAKEHRVESEAESRPAVKISSDFLNDSILPKSLSVERVVKDGLAYESRVTSVQHSRVSCRLGELA